jgi:hypothetical protein
MVPVRRAHPFDRDNDQEEPRRRGVEGDSEILHEGGFQRFRRRRFCGEGFAGEVAKAKSLATSGGVCHWSQFSVLLRVSLLAAMRSSLSLASYLPFVFG